MASFSNSISMKSEKPTLNVTATRVLKMRVLVCRDQYRNIIVKSLSSCRLSFNNYICIAWDGMQVKYILFNRSVSIKKNNNVIPEEMEQTDGVWKKVCLGDHSAQAHAP